MHFKRRSPSLLVTSTFPRMAQKVNVFVAIRIGGGSPAEPAYKTFTVPRGCCERCSGQIDKTSARVLKFGVGELPKVDQGVWPIEKVISLRLRA